MKQAWLSQTFAIASVYAFRMLGLFMLIPIFTPFAKHLTSATPWLIGVALGGYGLSQGLFQIPFGLWSDRYGRKPLIFAGLCLFICGSLLGAWTHSIYGMITARILQGAGAIGSVLMALLTDITPEPKRPKAMAIIGATIALSFSLAMLISPLLTTQFGLSSIFYVSVACGLAGLFIVHFAIPFSTTTPAPIGYRTQLYTALTNQNLQRLNFGIFCQHFILTSTFYALPLLLQHYKQVGAVTQTWHFYLLLISGAFVLMIPFMMRERMKGYAQLIGVTVGLTALSQFSLSVGYTHWISLCSLMLVYMTVFNILEANLPALIALKAQFGNKGTAMGIYSSCQFLGIFAGGVVAGFAYQIASYPAIFLANGIMASVWLIVTMPIGNEETGF